MLTTPAHQIEQLRSACGCKSGLVVMLLSLAGYVGYAERLTSPAGSMQRVLIGVGVAVAGGTVGKLAGLLWAHARLVRLLRRQAEGHASG